MTEIVPVPIAIWSKIHFLRRSTRFVTSIDFQFKFRAESIIGDLAVSNQSDPKIGTGFGEKKIDFRFDFERAIANAENPRRLQNDAPSGGLSGAARI
jgi:hypothetical protein